MTEYIIPKARCQSTGQTVAEQDLSGRRFQPHEHSECRRIAERLAEKMTARTGRQWRGFCDNFRA